MRAGANNPEGSLAVLLLQVVSSLQLLAPAGHEPMPKVRIRIPEAGIDSLDQHMALPAPG